MSERWRLFIGVLLPELTRTCVVQTQHALQTQSLAVRWTKPENLHITLHFLGDVDPAHISAIQSELDARLDGVAAPILELHQLGAFPALQRPSVLWVGVAGDLDGLRTLHQHAVHAGAHAGVAAPQHSYHPHITLGYVHRHHSELQRNAIVTHLHATPTPNDDLRPYNQIALIRSVLTPNGSQYTPLASWRLAYDQH